MSMMSWIRSSLLLLSFGLLVGAYAQSSTTGNITGTVRDPQGAAVPKAVVTIVEENSGESHTVAANSEGFYVARSLPSGIYTVSTAPRGFKKTVISGVQLRIGENKTVNLICKLTKARPTEALWTKGLTARDLKDSEIGSRLAHHAAQTKKAASHSLPITI